MASGSTSAAASARRSGNSQEATSQAVETPVIAVTSPVSAISCSVRPVARGMTFSKRCGQSATPPLTASQTIATIGSTTSPATSIAAVVNSGWVGARRGSAAAALRPSGRVASVVTIAVFPRQYRRIGARNRSARLMFALAHRDGNQNGFSVAGHAEAGRRLRAQNGATTPSCAGRVLNRPARAARGR